MTQNIRSSVFKYQSPIADSGDHTMVTVNVKELCYSDGKKYFDVTYDLDARLANKDHSRVIKNHPFFHANVQDFLTYDGEIIAKNPLTEMMVNYLLMDDAELAKFTGHTTPTDYKHKIMLSIAYFWD